MSKITFSEEGWDDYLYWQMNNKALVHKINELLKDIQRNGAAQGTGKPELLRYRKAWSRRIDHKNRLVYTVDGEGNILILSCEGHYDD